MKIENLPIVQRLVGQLAEVDKALIALSKPRSTFTENSPGWGRASDTKLYNVCITQYKDGSGFNVDLSGCCVGVELIKYAEQLLLAKRSDILTEISGL